MSQDAQSSPGAAATGESLDVLLVSEHNYPSQASGGRLLAQLCADLAASGHAVTAICSAVHYTTDEGIRLKARETHASVAIERYAPTRFDRRSLIGRTVNEVAYSLRVALSLARRKRPDVVIVLSSPPFMIPALALVSRIRRVPLVPVIMDVFPQMATVTGHLGQGSPLYRAWMALQRASLGTSRRIVVLGRCMRDVVGGMSPRVPIDVIPNWADDQLHPVPRSENRFLDSHPRLRSACVVMYSGNLGRFHDFETLLAAATRLRDREDVRFAIIGDGAKRTWLEAEVARRALSNVELLPFQPPEMLLHSLNAADIAVVTLEPGAEGLCVPSKFYPLLAVGRPVVAVMGARAEVARVVSEASCGVVVEPGDVDALTAAIRSMADDDRLREEQGRRGREVFLERFARRYAAPRYAATLHAALGPKETAADALALPNPNEPRDVRVERASFADLDPLVSLHMRYLSSGESLASAFGAGYVRSAYRWLLGDPGSMVLVARHGDAILGYTSLATGPYSGRMLRHGAAQAALGALRNPAVLAHPDLRARIVRAFRPRGATGDEAIANAEGTAHVAFTVVAAEARGQGVARALKAASIEACRAAGSSGIVTAVHAGNEASERLNLNAGFRELKDLRADRLRVYYLPLEPEARVIQRSRADP